MFNLFFDIDNLILDLGVIIRVKCLIIILILILNLISFFMINLFKNRVKLLFFIKSFI
jgi:hypothetical protein